MTIWQNGENSLLETANMIEPNLQDGSSAVVSICPYGKIQWVIVAYPHLSNFQLFHGESKLIFNEIMRSALF